ncbi:MAG: hypothetical protein KF889_16300 [Alphaproteobacteria bacterium]|nr:hypothetical protein [Alphaproteobacteria bacterium]MCW5740070.1 hypothetical protein [Alphaproteobacteria bacterium]
MRLVAFAFCLMLAPIDSFAADPAPRQRVQVYRQPSGATVIIRREHDIVLRNSDGTRIVIPATRSTPALPPRWRR